ncbi:MAG: amino acid permease, partial [Nonomuraea sp.]|nr:amino acid permease [Nonomuraea sp.]
VNRALTRLHPRWGSPWAATLVIGVPGIAMAALLAIEDLLGVTSVIVCVISILLAVAALRARSGELATAPAWRMPLWPAVPVVVIGALGYALAEQSATDLLITGGIVLAAAGYYLLYLRPRADTRWVVTTPEE